MRRVLGLALCLVIARPLLAGGDAPAPSRPTPEAAAEAVLFAAARPDAASALAVLAGRSDPDPWLVVDELLRRGKADAAAAFSAVATGPDLEGLAGYVVARRAATDDGARRERLQAAQAALTSGRFDAALERLGPPEEGTVGDVPGVRLVQTRALGLANLGRPKEASAAFSRAMEAAEHLGWLARAAQCAGLAARTALEGGDPAGALAALDRQRALASRRKDARGEAMALSGTGFVRAQQGDRAAAVSALEGAVAVWDASGDRGAAAAARMDLGVRLLDFGEPRRAVEVLQTAVEAFRGLADRPAEAGALVQLGEAQARAGAPAAAVAAWEAARARFVELGDKQGEFAAVHALGGIQSAGALRDDEKALPLLRRALDLAVELGDRGAEASAASRLASLHAQRVEREAARTLYERAIRLHEEAGDERQLAATLIDAGERFATGLLRDDAVALPWLERGLPLAEKLGERRWVANALINTGDLHRDAGRPAKALAAYERGIAVSAQAGLFETEAAAHLGIGRVRLEAHALEPALAAFERGLALLERAGNRQGQATALELIAKAHAARGAYPQAVAALQRALEALKPTGDAIYTAAILRSMAQTQIEFGDLQKALGSIEHALTLSEGRGDRVGAANALLVLGVVHHQMGAFAKALDADERARALQQAQGDRASAAMTLCNIGVVLWDLGQLDQALGIYERALAEMRAVGDRSSAATTLSNIGATHERLGDPARALELHREALAIWEELKDAGGAARVRVTMGQAHLAAGELDAALAESERGLAGLEAAGDKRGVVSAQVCLGRVLARRGAAAKAIQLYERAARGAEKVGATALLVEALAALAEARLGEGDAGRAVAEAHRAVELVKSLVGGLAEEQGASARGEHTALFSTGLRAAAAVADVAEAAFFLESGRAGALLEALGAREAMRWAGLPEELRQAEAQARAEEARALAAWNEAADGPDLAPARARRAELDAAREKVAAAVGRIQREAKKESRLAYPVATPVEDVQALLGEGEALVLYGLAKDAEPAHALVLTRGDARVIALGPTAALLSACEALHADDGAADVGPALERLRAVLWAPLRLPPGTRRVLVSPDGALAYVPFAALSPDVDLAYEASGSTYGVLREERGERGAKVLALGDPDYSVRFDPTALDLYAPRARAAASTPSPATRGARLVALPGTRAEATAVGDRTLLGKDASEAGLAEALRASPGPLRAVHFACHGLVDPDRPALSSLALTPDARNDGFLTVSEILRMDLKADLVVLSACETGRGKIAGGEGIVGLTRAFMFAGSPSVLCSLWKVDDEATAALMTRFYEVWNPKDGTPGQPAALALREAQAHVRAQSRWKHPYFWAAWVLWGLPD